METCFPAGFELTVPLAFTQLISLESGLRSEVLSLSTLVSYARKLEEEGRATGLGELESIYPLSIV